MKRLFALLLTVTLVFALPFMGFCADGALEIWLACDDCRVQDVADAFLRLVDKGEFRDPDDVGGGSMENIENIHSKES